MNFEQFLNEGKFGDAMGLSKAQTKKVAETLAKAISKHDDCKCTVNLKTLEEDAFDLDIDGEEFDGGSYNIYDDGSVVNMAINGGEKYGTVKSSVEDFIKGLDKPQKFESIETEGSELNEAFEVHYSDGIRAMKKFGSQSQAISFAKDLIKNKKGLQFVDVFNAGSHFHSTADTNAIVAFWGDGSYTDNVSKRDPKLAAKKIEESVESLEVNEAKKITLKRQYTESYPAKTVGKHAAIRNKIIETIKDGISKADFDQLVSGLTEDSKRWLKRNSTYFKISEEQVTLSAFGKRVLNQTAPKVKTDVNEAENNKIEISPNPAKSTFIYELFNEFVKNELNTDSENN
jgi:predicted DNA-binding WGR domain protein